VTAALIVPVVGALATWFTAGWRRSLTAAVAVLGAAVTAGALVVEVAQAGTPLERTLTGPFGTRFVLVADGLAAAMLVALVVVGVAVSAMALREERRAATPPHRAYWPLSLTLWAALVGLFQAGDLLTAYLLLEVVGLCGALLVSLRGGRGPLLAGTRYLFAELVASLTMLFGVAIVWWQTGTTAFDGLGTALAASELGWLGIVLVTVGLLIKIPLAPLHLWLPAAHTQAPSPVSPVLSGVMVKAAFTVLVRLWFLSAPELATPAAASLLGALGVVAIVWGSLTALRAEGLKRLAASSTVAQLGLLFLFPPLLVAGAVAGWTGAIVLAVAHAPAKAAMLIAATAMASSARAQVAVEASEEAADADPQVAASYTRHDPALERLTGAASRRPIAVMAFGIGGLSLVGLPPTGGFIGKWYLLLGAFEVGAWGVVAAIVVATLLSAWYLVRFLLPAFARPDDPALRERDGRDYLALGLAGVAVLIGLIPGPLLDLIAIGGPVGGQ